MSAACSAQALVAFLVTDQLWGDIVPKSRLQKLVTCLYQVLSIEEDRRKTKVNEGNQTLVN